MVTHCEATLRPVAMNLNSAFDGANSVKEEGRMACGSWPQPLAHDDDDDVVRLTVDVKETTRLPTRRRRRNWSSSEKQLRWPVRERKEGKSVQE